MTIPNSGADRRSLLANIALLYYGEGLTQSDIAARIKVSRTTVLNLLREARDLGIVDIRVDGQSLCTSHLADRLRRKFGLAGVYISQTLEDDGAELTGEALRQLGRIGGIALTEIAEPGDRIGVTWGVPVQAVAEQMTSHPVAGVAVYQMLGSIISSFVPASEKCAIDIAAKLGSPCFTLHAPALASTPKVAAVLRDEPTIRAQLDALKNLDLTIASVGNVADTTPMARADMITSAELARARAAGAVGILCCRFLDGDGRPLPLPPENRLLAAELDDMRRATRKLLIAGGADRLDATIAAIRGGYATHLCVGAALANRLLTAPNA